MPSLSPATLVVASDFGDDLFACSQSFSCRPQPGRRRTDKEDRLAVRHCIPALPERCEVVTLQAFAQVGIGVMDSFDFRF
jgi:hypothetical protein